MLWHHACASAQACDPPQASVAHLADLLRPYFMHQAQKLTLRFPGLALEGINCYAYAGLQQSPFKHIGSPLSVQW